MTRHEEATRFPVPVRVVKAFTLDGAGGNPAGVVLDADHLDDAAM